jgi:hypothetical protein
MDRVKILKSVRGRAIEASAGERVVFHHIPKCGGTSVALALRMRYVLSQTTVHSGRTYAVAAELDRTGSAEETLAAMYRLREEMLLYFLHEDVRCVSSHVPFSTVAHEEFGDRYRFITILRDPVERFVSHYFHSFERDDYSRIELPLERYVETPEAKRLGATCVSYLSGLPWEVDPAGEEAVAAARANLGRFDCIGITPDMDDFAARLHEVIGVKLRIGHANRGSESGGSYRERLAPELIERIAALCAPDLSLYEYASRLLRGEAA